MRLYGDDNPLDAPGFESKVKLLAEIDAYVRDKDPRVRQVTVAWGPPGKWSKSSGPTARAIATSAPWCGSMFRHRGQGDRQESGSKGYGGREGYAPFIESKRGGSRRRAIREALVNLKSVPARPAKWTWCWALAGPA